MQTIECHQKKRQTYYVPGSGLFPVPAHSINEVPLLKSEFHRAEVERALAAAKVRKLA